jgi:hypothetical protein
MRSPGEHPPFVRQRPGHIHPEIDLDELAKVLALKPLPAEPRRRLVGPHDLHVLEQLRRRRISRSPNALTADYFVWATGEGPHRAMTKIGGTPCLPASMPWPRRSGTIGDFYAQLSFVDSKDLVPSLPGDVLLVFRFHDLAHVNSWCEELYAFLWVDAEEQRFLDPQDVQRSRAGAAAGSWPALHGCRVRTFDDPGQLASLLAKGHGDVDLLIGEATKIGGAATDCQSVRPPNMPADWRFLGQVTSTWPATGVPFPVVDRSTAICGPDDADYERTVSGPGSGILCLYLDGRGDVRVFFSDS